MERKMPIDGDTSKKVEEVATCLEKFKQQIHALDFSENQKAFFAIIRKLDEYITSITDPKVCEAFCQSPHFHRYFDSFSHPHQYYMCESEALASLEIQKNIKRGTSDFQVHDDFMKIRMETKKNDLTLVDFSRVKKFVLVGSGSLPDTILFIVKNHDVPEIIGIDNDPSTISRAKKLIVSLGLNNVAIQHADGMSFDFCNTDLVYIPSFVAPKNRILDQIAKTAQSNVQICVETPLLLGKLFFTEVIFEELAPQLRVTGKATNETKYFRHHILKIEKM